MLKKLSTQKDLDLNHNTIEFGSLLQTIQTTNKAEATVDTSLTVSEASIAAKTESMESLSFICDLCGYESKSEENFKTKKVI